MEGGPQPPYSGSNYPNGWFADWDLSKPLERIVVSGGLVSLTYDFQKEILCVFAERVSHSSANRITTSGAYLKIYDDPYNGEVTATDGGIIQTLTYQTQWEGCFQLPGPVAPATDRVYHELEVGLETANIPTTTGKFSLYLDSVGPPYVGPSIDACLATNPPFQIGDGSIWTYSPWGCTASDPCVASFDTNDGTMWLGRPSFDGSGGYGPNGQYSGRRAFQTKSADETRKLQCGWPTNVWWDLEKTGSDIVLTMTNEDTIHRPPSYSFQRLDLCPDDPNKIEPGLCGCGVDDSNYISGRIANGSEWLYEHWQCTPSDPCVATYENDKLWIG
jgi:hypothetical protein